MVTFSSLDFFVGQGWMLVCNKKYRHFKGSNLKHIYAWIEYAYIYTHTHPVPYTSKHTYEENMHTCTWHTLTHTHTHTHNVCVCVCVCVCVFILSNYNLKKNVNNFKIHFEFNGCVMKTVLQTLETADSATKKSLAVFFFPQQWELWN